MGECGCTSDDVVFTFDGPDNYRYAFAVRGPCSNCGTGPSAGVYRYRTHPQSNCSEQWDGFDDFPTIEFPDDAHYMPVCSPIMNLDTKATLDILKTALEGVEVWGGEESQAINLDETDAEILVSDVIIPAIHKVIKHTISNSVLDIREELCKCLMGEQDNES